MVVRPNSAYIVPPNRDMAYLNGALQLIEPSQPHGQSLPIDIFFRSLEQDQRERAIGNHDFSQYKPSTIRRRVERRMTVHQIETIDNYARFMQQTPAEVESLYRDLLIGVTSFFRDPEAFRALEEQLVPKLFANKPAGATIRV